MSALCNDCGFDTKPWPPRRRTQEPLNTPFDFELKRHRRLKKRLVGRCHELTYDVIRWRDDCWLVQGFVPYCGLMMEHSWVQHKRTKLIYDPTIKWIGEPNEYSGEVVARYTRRQAFKLVSAHGFCGYWPADVGLSWSQAQQRRAEQEEL
jgi:hypothetical protein